MVGGPVTFDSVSWIERPLIRACHMPDKRRHRGRHPDDDRLFAEANLDTLRTAVSHLSWLLTRGYALKSSLKLVGDRRDLTARQRMAVRRCSCSDAALQRRRETCMAISVGMAPGIGIDGYNLLITIESALSGGLVMVGRDGCCRDLASVHGTYRKVAETVPALEIIVDAVEALRPAHVDWYLDQPVSNSGRLKAVLADVIGGRSGRGTLWNIELTMSPDKVLADYPAAVVTTDSVVLDRCELWINLAGRIISSQIPAAWVVDLRSEPKV